MTQNNNQVSSISQEHDSCGIIGVIEKNGYPSHDNIRKSIVALDRLSHRAGYINNEGDGVGVLTDIPRKLWAAKLGENNLDSDIAFSKLFVVGHIFIDRESTSVKKLQDDVRKKFSNNAFEIIFEEINQVNSNSLGQNGRLQEPLFWQITAIFHSTASSINTALYSLTIDIEKNNLIQVISLSNHSVVYKLIGEASILSKYFLDLANPLFESKITLGHNRYSTNTLTHFFRVQPFSLLGHNGEINTIERLKTEATMINISLVDEGSDSQNLNRVIEGIIAMYNLSLFSALELIFPPIYNEIHKYNAKLKDLYTFLRHQWGPFSQGPAGIISRYGNTAIFSVDALGLRPLWQIESDDTLYFSSEQGIISASDMVCEPKPLAPGEKVGLVLENNPVAVIEHYQVQEQVYNEVSNLFQIKDYHHKLEHPHFLKTTTHYPTIDIKNNNLYIGFGWEKEHIDLVEQMASTGKEPIRSLGYDGPLAILSKKRVNLSDFLKETVAVVTNPAIDREREIEHFSTRMILGGREGFTLEKSPDYSFEIRSPILLEGELSQNVTEQLGTTSLEQINAYFTSKSESYLGTLSLSFTSYQSIEERLEELNQEAINLVKNGAKVLILDDDDVLNKDVLLLDPHLALSSIDIALKSTIVEGNNLRRNVSIILRSGSIRNLHDLITAIGLGANAVSPYLLFASVSQDNNEEQVKNLYLALNKGIEKVISTLGIHELRGYERLFSSIGLHKHIAEILNITNFYGSDEVGYSFIDLKKDAEKRFNDFRRENITFEKSYHLIPRIWKLIEEVANGSSPYQKYKDKLKEQTQANPVTIRHLLDFKYSKAPFQTEQVNIGIGIHDFPFIISSMSFGAQNEIPFRAYAEAASQLNMLSLNGEGGEIKDMLGKYPNNRGMQIASGRFGVNIELLNSSNLIEIKIGQGAKPGEGGHLPGTKVSEKIASARNAAPGTDLISPSNNHDIYSIEDLAQIITEIKTANEKAKVIVKVPVVPNIGTIAVGIAKAGADVVSLSGYDGGTGAARVHALQHVGLPIEIGVKLAHASLEQSSLRNNVEIWADGGVKSGDDVVKLILLGANRVGFGTLAMIAIGCTGCRGCHLDTCHVGISTQIDSIEQANERGLKRFVPREQLKSVDNLKRLFTKISEETKEITAQLGANSLQDLVGRSDLLIQTRYNNLVDLSELIMLTAYKKKHNQNTYSLENKLSMAIGMETSEIKEINHLNPVYNYEFLNNTNRVYGSSVSGIRASNKINGGLALAANNFITKKGSIPGNGLAAYLADGVNIEVHGGGQDGVGKTAYGGKVFILKTLNKDGIYINGSVGKGFCYGAQSGLFIIQGNADSRAGIRLSGADVIIGGEITSPINDQLGGIATRANIKGFAFEYMTNGRAIVLGDPGPWICSGMTGGVIYQRLNSQFGFDINALKRRIAKGAEVAIVSLDDKGRNDLIELLNIYIHLLIHSGQREKSEQIMSLLSNLEENFVRIIPVHLAENIDILTE